MKTTRAQSITPRCSQTGCGECSKKEVGKTKFLLRVGDAKVSGCSKNRHHKCIMGSTKDIEFAHPSALESADIMQKLTAGISRKNEVISESNVLSREEFGRKQEKDEEKKNRFSKIHSSFQNMLLIASSIDGDRTATTVSPSCLSFFKQETAGLANQQLLVIFREMGLPDVGFSH